MGVFVVINHSPLTSQFPVDCSAYLGIQMNSLYNLLTFFPFFPLRFPFHPVDIF